DVDDRTACDLARLPPDPVGISLADPNVAQITAATGDGNRHGVGHDLELLYRPVQVDLGPPSVGNVPEDQDDADHPTVLISNRCSTVVYLAFRAVPGDQDGVVRQTDDLARGDHRGDRVPDRLPCNFVDDGEDHFEAASRRFLAGPPDECFGDRVEQRHPSFGVGRDDAI